MMVLLPNSTPMGRRVVRENPARWGWFITPRGSFGRAKHTIPGARWAMDNDCFSLGDNFDPAQFRDYIARYTNQAPTCLFVTAPDVVGDGRATLERFTGWHPKIRAEGYPVALVAQDGIESLRVPWDDLDALFIGGTTDWKLGGAARALVQEANRRGKWTHVGRVNSRKRLLYFARVGADSIDGTHYAIAPNHAIRWTATALAEIEAQMTF